ncbi:hypothetical protein FZC33_00115 [Labrys sp. KNU-23]|uniref:hypothetical protein n=1 Tax=Labrys sp. KNU-23 TaxID=2789216 RepID=UPI0011EE47CE|nr:hypothetical protein [Labrys sp. KNU-23]QEN84737.1 hypothetical protein FZC33_00115 [Labrys sp. KNU-23]
MLKGAIFSLHDVLAKQGVTDGKLLGETFRLLRYLKQRGIEPVFVSNKVWTVTNAETGVTRPFRELLEEQLGPVGYYVGGQNAMPFKPRAEATAFILARQGWTNREVVFIGNSDIDMRTASTGQLMFLNATWHGVANPYGFQFGSPLDIARFIDCLCLGLNDWFWAINDGPLRVYSMAPFSTLSSQYLQAHAYSANARATSKHGTGDANFWGRLLAARVYFSGLVDEIDYITAYPGHAPDSPPTVIADALNILGGSLRKSYLPDLLIRHTKAQKSQTARIAGKGVDVVNQLTTLMLNSTPQRGMTGKTYKNMPVGAGKTVLLVDDFCTEGNSFEAGRAFINSTGAKTICLSWLKTIKTDYRAISPAIKIINPYERTGLGPAPSTKLYAYSSAIISHAAEIDLAEVYDRYFKWAWPADC